MRLQLAYLAAVLLVASSVIASGLWLIDAKHEARRLFVEVEELNREQDRLQIDWGRLQLEQSTWATHPRIESLARERLSLIPPAGGELVVVVEPP